MGVEVDRQIEPRSQSSDQGRSSFGAKKTSHVLDGQDVCPTGNNLLR